MKVLMSAFACSPIRGSEPGVGWNWAREMSKMNEVWVITRSSNRTEIEQFGDNNNINFVYISLPGIEYMEKYTSSKFIHLYYYLWQKHILNYANKLHERENFDIVHHVTYNEFRNPGFLWKTGIPFVLGPIGGAQKIESELLDYCEGERNKKIEKAREIINLRSKKSKYLARSIKNASTVITANSDTARFLELEKGSHVVMLETGIKKENCNYFLRDEKEFINLLWVGNLIYIKGFRLLIDAFSKINYKEKYKITIIGEGKLKTKYIEYLEEKGLSQHFIFKGKLSYSDVLMEYKNADIFIFTSLRDTSGNVVLEAMSNCLPIITLDHHGAADMVDENCAIKIKIRNKEQVVNDLVESIQNLGNNHSKRLEMGLNSYKRVQENYLWENKGIKMQQIYNEISKKR